jgi:hypothetical protein
MPAVRLLTLVALLLMLVPASPAAQAADPAPTFQLMPPRGAAAAVGAGGEVVGTIAGDPPPLQLAAAGVEGLPLVTLPSGMAEGAPPVIERDLGSTNDVRVNGLSAERAAAMQFGPESPTLNALSGACAPMIRNSQIFAHQDEDTGFYNVYNWLVLKSKVYVETDEYFSYPYALSMRDGDESESDGRPGRDEDWFGQDFYFPADGQSMLIEFNVRFPSGGGLGFDDADFSYVELFRLDANGNLIDEQPGTADLIEGIVVRRLDPEPGETLNANQWYRFGFFFDETTWPSFDLIKGQRMALVFDTDGDQLPPFEKTIIDNPQVTVCPSTAPPDRAVQGFVAVQGLPLANQGNTSITTANLGLLYRAGPTAAPELVRVTNPFESGYYRFRGLPALPEGASYQVIYLNSGYEEEPEPDGGQRMAYFLGPLVGSFSDIAANDGYFYGEGGYFDLGDIALGGPEHYEEVAGDVVFDWSPRSFNGDTALEDAEEGYFLCFYEPNSLAEVCTDKPVQSGSLALNAAQLAAIPGFPFALGAPLGWYVRVAATGYDPDTPAFDGVGASRFSKFVTFVAEAPTPPPSPPREDTPPPADPPGDTDDWTLMFYLAGDDEALTNPPGNSRSLVDVLSNLNQLAERHPNINVVAQFDFFESEQQPLDPELRGTQRCFFRPDVLRLADACQQLGEQNTGDPAVLAEFINAAMARYPATHTALIIMGHGNAVTGVAGDRSSNPDDALRPFELEQAYEAANLDEPDRRLDLLVYYSCLMGSFETATIASRFADYMVGSPNITTLVDVTGELAALAAANPGPTGPRAVAVGLVNAYNTALTRYNTVFNRDLSIAMAAYDLSKLAALQGPVSTLAQAIMGNLELAQVGAARAGVQLYDSSAPTLWGFTEANEDALVDLRHLASLLAVETNPNNALRTAAAAVLNQLDANGGVVIANARKSGVADLVAGGQHTLSNASGLSIYFPTGVDVGNQATLTRSYLLYFRQTSFRSSAWDELVDATRTGIPSLPRGVRVSAVTAGTPGSTLMNLSTPELFPTLSALPDETQVRRLLYLPLLRR